MDIQKDRNVSILAEVKKLGQQIWLDNLSRSLIQ